MYYLLDIYIFVPWSLSPHDQSSNTISTRGVMSANVGARGGGGVHWRNPKRQLAIFKWKGRGGGGSI